MLGPLTPQEAELAGSFDRGGALRLEVQDPSRLADKRWYDGSIFNGLTKELSAWANIFCSDVLAGTFSKHNAKRARRHARRRAALVSSTTPVAAVRMCAGAGAEAEADADADAGVCWGRDCV